MDIIKMHICSYVFILVVIEVPDKTFNRKSGIILLPHCMFWTLVKLFDEFDNFKIEK